MLRITVGRLCKLTTHPSRVPLGADAPVNHTRKPAKKGPETLTSASVGAAMRDRFRTRESYEGERLFKFLQGVNVLNKSLGPPAVATAVHIIYSHDENPQEAIGKLREFAKNNNIKLTARFYRNVLEGCKSSEAALGIVDEVIENVDIMAYPDMTRIVVDILGRYAGLDSVWKLIKCKNMKVDEESGTVLIGLCKTPQDAYRVLSRIQNDAGRVHKSIVDKAILTVCTTKKQGKTLLDRLSFNKIISTPSRHYPALITLAFRESDFSSAKDLFQRATKTEPLYYSMLHGVINTAKEIDDGYCLLTDDLLKEAEDLSKVSVKHTICPSSLYKNCASWISRLDKSRSERYMKKSLELEKSEEVAK